jgi:hypothetical protein
MTPARAALTTLTIAAVLTAAGCSTGDAPSASTSTTASSTSATSSTPSPPASTGPSAVPANTTVHKVTINGKNVTPPPGNVDVPLGKTLRLIVTSDHDDQLHAHGFDIEENLKAGVPTTLDLKATTPGIYEIEPHHPPLTLLHVVVR